MLTKNENALLIQALRNIPFFSSLNEADLHNIIEAPDNGVESYISQSLIVREAEPGDCMYVIMDGCCVVNLRSASGGRENTIASLYAGDYFGEQALLPGGTGRRNASVRALHDSRLFRISRPHILKHVQPDEADELNIELDTPEDRDIKNLLKKMRLFRSLQPAELENFHEWAEVVEVGAGDFIIKQGQPGDELFVVLEGVAEVFLLDEEGRVIVLAQNKRGHYFGEQALLPESDGKRNAYVRMEQRGRLLRVPRQQFLKLLTRDNTLTKTLARIGKLQNEVNKLMSKS